MERAATKGPQDCGRVEGAFGGDCGASLGCRQGRLMGWQMLWVDRIWPAARTVGRRRDATRRDAGR